MDSLHTDYESLDHSLDMATQSLAEARRLRETALPSDMRLAAVHIRRALHWLEQANGLTDEVVRQLPMRVRGRPRPRMSTRKVNQKTYKNNYRRS